MRFRRSIVRLVNLTLVLHQELTIEGIFPKGRLKSWHGSCEKVRRGRRTCAARSAGAGEAMRRAAVPLVSCVDHVVWATSKKFQGSKK
jgi:hypothetical protein